MDNHKKYQILLCGKYKNLFIRGAFPSIKKRKNKQYKKVIHYNHNFIDINILELDNINSIEEQINHNFINNNFKQDGIFVLFVIDATDDNYILEIDSLITDLKKSLKGKDYSIDDYILLGIIPKNCKLDNNNYMEEISCIPLLVFHKLSEKHNCFCYELEETEEEIEYNLFLANYAMFNWIELNKTYSNQELREIMDKNTGYENKDIKIKYYNEKELKCIVDKKKKKRELSKNKEKDKIESSRKKLIKTQTKEENKKNKNQSLIIDSLKKRYTNINNIKNNYADENKEKDKLKRSNTTTNTNISNKTEENKKEKLIELYNQEIPSIFRCIYCYEIPEIQIINDKYVKIKCKNINDEKHIGKENIINIEQFQKICFNPNEIIKEINYNKNKCIYCNKNQQDIINDFKEFYTMINCEQKENENSISYEELKNNFFYYYNDNKMFFCNICRNFICQNCKNFHLLFCKPKNKINQKPENINIYENYEDIKHLIEDKIIDYNNEINLNKQFMPLYMYDTFCSIHKRPYNFFCQNCNKNLCNDCLEHNEHNIIDWIDFENILILKNEEIIREKNIINNLHLIINEFIQDLSIYFYTLLKKQRDLIDIKEKIINNAKKINNNYYIYKNVKNIEFNLKFFEETIFKSENNVMKKLSILLDYFKLIMIKKNIIIRKIIKIIIQIIR